VRLPVYEYIFLHNHRAVAGVEGSWRGNQHLQVFLPRSDYFNEDSFAECQRGRKPIPASCDYDGMNTFFSTTIERRRIERSISHERNPLESHSPFYLRAKRTGPGATERWLQSVSVSSELLIGTKIRPTGNESVKQILTPQDMDTL
jgi:hypothetical protein